MKLTVGLVLFIAVFSAACTPKENSVTPTATSAASNNVSAYIDSVTPALTDLTYDMNQLSILAGTPSFASTQWKSNILSMADRIIADTDTILAIKVPSGFEDIGRETRAAMLDYRTAMGMLKDGVTNSNVSKISSSADSMKSGTAHLSVASALLARK